MTSSSSRAKPARRPSLATSTLCLLCLCPLLLLSACTSTSSLKRSQARYRPLNTLPLHVALLNVEDGVACDEEALYLQQAWQTQKAFLDVELIPNNLPDDERDADVLVSGKIAFEGPHKKRLGYGTFFSIITLGGYSLLGGPGKTMDATISYEFDVVYAGRPEPVTYRFTDQLHATYGMYGASLPIAKKPGAYQAGFRELYEKIRQDIDAD